MMIRQKIYLFLSLLVLTTFIACNTQSVTNKLAEPKIIEQQTNSPGYNSNAKDKPIVRQPVEDAQLIGQFIDMNSSKLKRIIARGEEPRKLQMAIWTLVNRLSLDPDTANKIAGLLETSQDIDVLRTALLALTLHKDCIPVEKVTTLALKHPSVLVRRSALRTLWSLRDDSSREVLLKAARDDNDPDNRCESIALFSLLVTEPEAIRVANNALTQEQDPKVRTQWLRLTGTEKIKQGGGPIMQE